MNRLEQIYLWSFAIVAAALCFSNLLFNIAIGFWGLMSLIILIKKREFPLTLLKKNKAALAMLALFGSLLLGVTYSSDTKAGLFMVERSLLFLAAPLLMLAVPLLSDPKKAIRFAHGGFITGITISIIWAWVFAFGRLYDPINIEMHPDASFRINYYFTYHGFASAVNMHAVYLAVYLLLGLFILFEAIRTKKVTGVLKNVAYGISLILVVGLFQMKSANISFTFLLLLLLYSIAHSNFDKGVKRLWSFGSAFFTALMVGILLFKANALRLETVPVILLTCAFLGGWFLPKLFPHLQNRSWLPNPTLFVALLLGIVALTLILPQIGPLEEWAVNHPSNISARYWNWRSATDLILKNPLLGLGTGENTDALMARYAHYQFEGGLKYEYNEHSQYLRYWLEAGLLSLLAFIWLLYELYVRAAKSGYFPFIALTFVSVLFCVTESALARRHFISFFVFFSLLYSYAFLKGKKAQRSSTKHAR